MKRKKAIIISTAAICTIIGGGFATYVAIVNLMNQQLYGRGRILAPTSLDVNPTQFDWGSIRFEYANIGVSQPVTVTNRGSIPLRVQAYALSDSMFPSWFKEDLHWQIGWSADGYVLGAHETVSSTFKMWVDESVTETYMYSHNLTEFSFDVNVQMLAGPWTENNTVVHYCSVYDFNAADLIATNKSLELYRGIHQVLGLKDPAVFDPLYDRNNIIVLGGWTVNPYTAYYFPEYHVENGVITGGSGISPDGRRVVSTKTRANGYKITTVFGYSKEDTFTAAQDYLGIVPPPTQQYYLQISSSINGTTSPVVGTYAYSEGTLASVTASPVSSHTLDFWTLDGANAGNVNPLQIIMASNHTVFCTCKKQTVQGPTMTVSPSVLHASVGSTVTLNITVNNVANLFAWQIFMNYTPSLLNCTGATLPLDHVFAGKTIVPVIPIIDNTVGSVMYGITLMTDSFAGNGTLCQLQFKVLKAGTCNISFSSPYGADSFLLDVDLNPIPAQTVNGLFASP